MTDAGREDLKGGPERRVEDIYEHADHGAQYRHMLENEVRRLRELEDASGILLDVLEDMKPSGADVPAELDYAMDDLCRALEPSDD